MFKNILLVASGGAIGSVLRYLIYLILGQKAVPFSTLLINIIGSFVIGIIVGYGIKHHAYMSDIKLFIAIGLCGGFTTFSAFSIENLNLLQNGKIFLCAFYIAASILFGILAAWFGYSLGMRN